MSLPDDFETHPVGTGEKLERFRKALERIVSNEPNLDGNGWAENVASEALAEDK